MTHPKPSETGEILEVSSHAVTVAGNAELELTNQQAYFSQVCMHF